MLEFIHDILRIVFIQYDFLMRQRNNQNRTNIRNQNGVTNSVHNNEFNQFYLLNKIKLILCHVNCNDSGQCRSVKNVMQHSFSALQSGVFMSSALVLTVPLEPEYRKYIEISWKSLLCVIRKRVSFRGHMKKLHQTGSKGMFAYVLS